MPKAHAVRVGLGVVLAVFAVGAAPLYAGEDIKVSPAQSKAMGIATVPLAGGAGTAARPLPARVVIPNQQLHIVSAPLAGMIESMAVAANQPVKRGQVLGRLQSPGLVEIQRGLLQAATQAQLARESLARDEKLFKDGIIAESRYLAARSRNTEALAALSERRQALRLAGLSDAAVQRLENSHLLSGSVDIVAPVTGIALETMAVPGQRVDAAAPLYKLAHLVPLWLEIQVPIAQAAGLQSGVAVSVPGYRASGKLIQIGRSVEEGSQTVAVRAEIGQGAENLRPGQFVEATLAVTDGAKNWYVPNTALIRQRDQAYIFVQTTGGFRAIPVKLAGETARGTLISGDLKGDERIAVSGAASLKALWQGAAEGGN